MFLGLPSTKFLVPPLTEKLRNKTRMHSSRLCTAHLLTDRGFLYGTPFMEPPLSWNSLHHTPFIYPPFMEPTFNGTNFMEPPSWHPFMELPTKDGTPARDGTLYLGQNAPPHTHTKNSTPSSRGQTPLTFEGSNDEYEWI